MHQPDQPPLVVSLHIINGSMPPAVSGSLEQQALGYCRPLPLGWHRPGVFGHEILHVPGATSSRNSNEGQRLVSPQEISCKQMLYVKDAGTGKLSMQSPGGESDKRTSAYAVGHIVSGEHQTALLFSQVQLDNELIQRELERHKDCPMH